MRKRKAVFTEEAGSRHKKLAKPIHRTLLDSRLLIMVSAPAIWACLVPLMLMDAVTSFYRWICFPIYGIPRVQRSDYILIDRHRLSYLNPIEKLNCIYCGYANGLLAYVGEMAGRTEQFWCPIKHALRLKAVHSRYREFIDYGNAEEYRERIEELRRSFDDLDREDESE